MVLKPMKWSKNEYVRTIRRPFDRPSFFHGLRYSRSSGACVLLRHLLGLACMPDVLIGTWEDATWTILFYERHGFEMVSREERDKLLRSYWNIPQRQIETSVVLRREKS